MSRAEFRDRFLSRAGQADIVVPDPELDQIQAYYELITHWNRRINLTALRLEPLSADTIDRLLIEPLVAAHYVENAPLEWFDLGSGAGSPAFPLKIARPRTRLTLVESRLKKAAFLREVVRELRLSEANVSTDRFERLSDSPEVAHSVQVVTARAVRVDEPMLGAVQKLLVAGGRLLFFGSESLQLPPTSPLELIDSAGLRTDGSSRLFILQAIPSG